MIHAQEALRSGAESRNASEMRLNSAAQFGKYVSTSGVSPRRTQSSTFLGVRLPTIWWKSTWCESAGMPDVASRLVELEVLRRKAADK